MGDKPISKSVELPIKSMELTTIKKSDVNIDKSTPKEKTEANKVVQSDGEEEEDTNNKSFSPLRILFYF